MRFERFLELRLERFLELSFERFFFIKFWFERFTTWLLNKKRTKEMKCDKYNVTKAM